MNLKKLLLTMFVALSSVMNMMAYTVNVAGGTYGKVTVYVYDEDEDDYLPVGNSVTSFEEGTELMLQATVKNRYEGDYVFEQWADGETNARRFYTVPSAEGEITFTANFVPYVEKVKLTVKSNNVEWGTTTGTGTYAVGSNVTISATPEEGYQFVTWEDGIKNATRTITVTEAATIYATFAEIAKYNIDVYSNNPNMGTVTGGGSYLSGTSVHLTATPKSGYYFAYWSDGSFEADRYVDATSNKNFTATFSKLLTLDVVPDVDDAGSTTGATTGLKPGDKVTVEAIPNTGYVFVKWSDGNTTNPRVVTMEDEKVTLVAQFREVRYTLTLGVNDGAMGSVIGTSGEYKAGMAVNISASANANYEFVGWSDGVATATRTVTMDANKNLTANFEPIRKAVRDISNGNLGTICLPRAVAEGDFEGAKFYKIAYKEVDAAGNLVDMYFDEVTELEAGMPYIFAPEAGASNIYVKYTGAAVSTPGSYNGLHGTFERTVLPSCYAVSGKKLVKCAAGSVLGANRAYILLGEVYTENEYVASGAPAAPSRISLSTNESNVATDLDALFNETISKVMIDGQVYIQREGHLYSVSGQLVK